jgi:hypothetical protein
MTTRPDAPKPIGHARAHELADRERGLGLVESKLAACRRIRRALDDDREARVLGLITARPAWLPWSPLGDGRYRRRSAMRQLVRDLALLGAATATVWLVFVAGWQAWP